MLPKTQRADKKAVERIFSTGRFVGTAGLFLKFMIDAKGGQPVVSFIVPKSVSKKAVERNTLRRKGYAVIRKWLSRLPQGFVGAFVFKRKVVDIEKEIEKLIDKIY